MGFFKLLIVIALAGLGYKYWSEQQHTASIAAVTSAQGFVSLPPLDGGANTGIIVFAAQNCPQEAAQRANALADQLSREGLPVSRRDHASFSNLQDGSVTARINAVMNGPLPIVFVNGAAKANPSKDEVLAQYRASKR